MIGLSESKPASFGSYYFIRNMIFFQLKFFDSRDNYDKLKITHAWPLAVLTSMTKPPEGAADR